ncbi:hypothetical protein CBL_05048 [Carabus blaptoides fortunei]
MFACRYPNISSKRINERARFLRSENGIVDVIEETAYGFRYAAQSLFLAACSRCSSILVRDGVKQMVPYKNDESIVAQYYSRHHIPLNISCVRKNVVHWYVCTICKHVDLLTKYPLASESNKYLPLPKYVAELTNDDRRNISLVALNSTTAKARSDATRVFQHIKGDLTMRHLNEKQYFQMYAMIVSSVPVSKNRTPLKVDERGKEFAMSAQIQFEVKKTTKQCDEMDDNNVHEPQDIDSNEEVCNC